MDTLVFWAVIFAVPLFALITLFVAINFKGYTAEKFSVSRLGTKRSKYHGLFTAAGFILGVLVYVFGKKSSLYIEDFGLPVIFSQLILIVGVASTSIALLPFDKVEFLHNTVGGLNIFFTFLLAIVVAHTSFLNNLFPKHLAYLSWGLIVFTTFFAFSYFMRKKNYFPKGTWFLEWGMFIFSLAFLFFFAVEFLHIAS